MATEVRGSRRRAHARARGQQRAHVSAGDRRRRPLPEYRSDFTCGQTLIFCACFRPQIERGQATRHEARYGERPAGLGRPAGRLADITIDSEAARAVLTNVSLPRFERATREVFGAGFELLPRTLRARS